MKDQELLHTLTFAAEIEELLLHKDEIKTSDLERLHNAINMAIAEIMIEFKSRTGRAMQDVVH